MSALTRRTFLQQIIASGSIAALPPLLARCASSAPPAVAATDYGPLRLQRASNTDQVLLELPEGFSCIALGREQSPLLDGSPTPPLHGGLGAIQLKKELRLVRNHGSVKPSSSLAETMHSYDPMGGGATTTLVIDRATRAVMLQGVSIAGLANTSGGGVTPWGSWIACEATTRGVTSGYTMPHGYCFEIRADLAGGVIPVPLKSLGRFVHASACMDPLSAVVFLTEHGHGGAGLYRCVPRRPGALAAGGKLQMLAIVSQAGYDAKKPQKLGEELPVEWVDIAEADPSNAESRPSAVFEQGLRNGGATFESLGGIAYDDGAVFFTATDGAQPSRNRVWRYRFRPSHSRAPLPGETSGTMQLMAEWSEPETVRAGPEICASPRGGLLVCGREGALTSLTRDGKPAPFARSAVQSGERARFGGATFSPDGETLFVNQQNPGLTLAITGPWIVGPL